MTSGSFALACDFWKKFSAGVGRVACVVALVALMAHVAVAQDSEETVYRIVFDPEMKADANVSFGGVLDYVSDSSSAKSLIESAECENAYVQTGALHMDYSSGRGSYVKFNFKSDALGHVSRVVIRTEFCLGKGLDVNVNGVMVNVKEEKEYEFVIDNAINTLCLSIGEDDLGMRLNYINIYVDNAQPQLPGDIVAYCNGATTAVGCTIACEEFDRVEFSSAFATEIEVCHDGITTVYDGPAISLHPDKSGEYTVTGINADGRTASAKYNVEVSPLTADDSRMFKVSRNEQLVNGGRYVIYRDIISKNNQGKTITTTYYVTPQYYPNFEMFLSLAKKNEYKLLGRYYDDILMTRFERAVNQWFVGLEEYPGGNPANKYLGSNGTNGFIYTTASPATISFDEFGQTGKLRLQYETPADKYLMVNHSAKALGLGAPGNDSFVFPDLFYVDYADLSTGQAIKYDQIVPVDDNGKTHLARMATVEYTPQYPDDAKEYYLYVGGVEYARLEGDGNTLSCSVMLPPCGASDVAVVERFGSYVVAASRVESHPWQELADAAVNAPDPGGKYMYYNSSTRAIDVRMPVTTETSYPLSYNIVSQNYPHGYINNLGDGRYEYVIEGYLTDVDSDNGNIDLGDRQLPKVTVAISPVFDIAYKPEATLARSASTYRHGTFTGTPTPIELALENGQISSINDITGDATAPARYYDLQGRSAAPTAPGIYLRHQGPTTTKIVVK